LFLNAKATTQAARSAAGSRLAGRRSAGFFLFLFITVSLSGTVHAADAPSNKQTARLQFQKAEQMREALNGRPESERSRRDYQHVIDAYRKVYYLSPASSKADASVVAVAELLAAAGRQFQPGEKDLHAAIGQYEFLRREYPGSKYRVEALFTMGQICKEDLDDPTAARTTFEEFLRRYPHDQLVPKARGALAELNRPKPKTAEVAEADNRQHAKVPAQKQQKADLTPAAASEKTGFESVTGIRHWSSPESTRVAIDVDGPVEYQAGRVPNPDRIFFDLPNTRLVSTLLGKSFDVQDGFLKKIRVAQYQPDSTRVVLDVENVADYSAFVLPNPYRLIIDVHGRQTSPTTETAKAVTPRNTEAAQDESTENSSRSILSGNISVPHGTSASRASTSSPSTSASATEDASTRKQTASLRTKRVPPTTVVVDDDAEQPAEDSDGSIHTTGSGTHKAGVNAAASTSHPKTAAATSANAEVARKDDRDGLLAASDGNEGPEIKATSQPTSAPTAVAVAPRDKAAKKGTKSAAQTVAAREAVPTSSGDRSLIRALGLKIGRIVIDAGHGGHDTGTIGPTGLMEKDLVLDVALRLGRLLETRLGADVIYTRDDDTFIPLETRTAIANEKQADLFISVHANSSPDPEARGVETYYLNFTSSSDALEVAARENAVSEKSIHELQDLVKKITLKEKIDESRELASDVQTSLYQGLSYKNPSLHNRGVKKAPFVVLIGANMPSILAEISFVSNPTDEQRLETPEYRQKIAESLYRGIAKYVGGLSGVKVASKMSKETGE
jgi:N-acetylmuramoyl-L-alanine amidase